MKNFIKISSVLCACFLLCVGIWCMLGYEMKPVLLGVSLLVASVVALIGFAVLDYSHRSNWVFLESLVSLIAGVIIILLNTESPRALYLLFGLYIICFGALKICQSIELQRSGNQVWLHVMALAVVGLVLGLVCIFNSNQTGYILDPKFVIAAIFAIKAFNCFQILFIDEKIDNKTKEGTKKKVAKAEA